MRDREHLDHLPGRSYLLVVGAAGALATGVAVVQMVSSDDWAGTVLWGAMMVLGAVSLIALAVACGKSGGLTSMPWSERPSRRIRRGGAPKGMPPHWPN